MAGTSPVVSGDGNSYLESFGSLWSSITSVASDGLGFYTNWLETTNNKSIQDAQLQLETLKATSALNASNAEIMRGQQLTQLLTIVVVGVGVLAGLYFVAKAIK